MTGNEAAPWYEAVDATTPITQGDLILDCPILVWDTSNLQIPTSNAGRGITALRAASRAIVADVVIMTQACDLEQGKVDTVMLCQHFTLTDYRNTWTDPPLGNDKWRSLCDNICKGYVWNLMMLNEGESRGLVTECRIIDFHRAFSVPRAFLEWHLGRQAQPRLRLLSPYREHLSQAFARCYMRVGLPTPVARIWQAKPTPPAVTTNS